MPALIRAIDLLFHCTAGGHAERGLKCFHSPARSLAEMDAAGIAAAFVSQCKQWSCERQWMCVDTRLDDVLHYTQASPRFFGLAGYNPFDIADSMREIELGVATHRFRGIFAHAASFGLPLTGALMYPLFAKAVELGIPIVVQLGADLPHLQDLRRLFTDFPELILVVVASQPEPEQMSELAAQCENLYFALDSAALARLAAGSQAADFFTGPVFRDRCMWGSNGVAWPESVRACQSLPLSPEVAARFLHDNAVRVFALDRPLPARTPRSAMTEILVAER
jgi:predicted TIM-barrel fold metal-dependent hydrolase